MFYAFKLWELVTLDSKYILQLKNYIQQLTKYSWFFNDTMYNIFEKMYDVSTTS